MQGLRSKGCLPLLKRLVYLCLAVACVHLAPAIAGDSTIALEQEINAFMQGPDHAFAPETAARAQAYLGAAMLPDIQHNSREIHARLAAARSALAEAKRLAAEFRRKHAELIRLRLTARQAVGSAAGRGLDKAEKLFATGIHLMEAGDLNQSNIYLDKARKAYADIVSVRSGPVVRDYAELLEQTRRTLSRAAAAGAKSYAPRTYEAAKEAMRRLRAFVERQTDKVPDNPTRALQLAEKARRIAMRVKEWRRRAGSHEQLLLAARIDRLRLAQALGMNVKTDDLLADVRLEDLMDALARIRAELQAERKAHETDMARLRKEQEEQLAQQKQRLEADFAMQRQALFKKQAKLVSDLKESFRAKLERETFEARRLQRLRRMFHKGEVEILSNLDGSLLIRLKALKFPPGGKSVSSKYFDLLGRLKSALDLYAERKVSIEGHTDDRGDVQKNKVLSLRRAEAVRDFLISAGVDASRLTAVGHGEVLPIASNKFEKGRAMNRRIDVMIAPPNA